MKKRLCEWRFRRCWTSFTPFRINTYRVAVCKSKTNSLIHMFIHVCSVHAIKPCICLYRDVREDIHISVLRELQEEKKIKVSQGNI